jgi:endonuclease III-like uncharacterized protein
MENRELKKETYVEPKIIATYTKEELEETIKPHGSITGYADGDLNNHAN